MKFRLAFMFAVASSASAFSVVVRQSTRSAAVAPRAFLPATRLSMSSSATPSATANDVLEFAKSEIAQNQVVVFSKSYCPFCFATKDLLSNLNIEHKVWELDDMPNGAELQAALTDYSGQRTVPNVFVNGQHVGGNDKMQAAARSGKLQEMLKQ